VGETGWPSAGRQREGAAPSLVNEARFTREFIAYANAHSLPNNFIEAYDQPWKKALEGTVGGYWGLYDADGNEKFPLIGPVIEDTHWWRGLLAGSIFAIILVSAAWINKVRPMLQLIAYALAGYALGAVLLLQWLYWMISNRNWQEWLCAVAWGVACDVIFIGALLPRSAYSKAMRIVLIAAEATMLFGLAYINLGLVFDARYRDFPTMFLVLPMIAMLIAKLNYSSQESISSGLHPLYTVMFCFWMLVSVCIIAWIEKLTNHQAIGWCICCLLLAWGWLPRISTRGTAQLTQTQP
jgi:glucan 1,3-beta-glucosidase